jgi:hypothetical protein
MDSTLKSSDYLRKKGQPGSGALGKHGHAGGHEHGLCISLDDNDNVDSKRDIVISIISSSQRGSSAARRIRWKRVLCVFASVAALMLLIVVMATACVAIAKAIMAATAAHAVVTPAGRGGNIDNNSSDAYQSSAAASALSNSHDMDAATVHVIQNAALAVSGDNAFSENTPAHVALEWLMNQSNQHLVVVSGMTQEMIAQRFALVTVLFALYGNNDKGRAKALIMADNTSECEWTDLVTCNEQGFVTKLYLGEYRALSFACVVCLFVCLFVCLLVASL